MQATRAHGRWDRFRNSHGTMMLSITFYWTGDDSAERLQNHLLQEITAGVYRTTDNMQVYYVPAEFEKAAPVQRDGLEPIILDEKNTSNVKHLFLWLHPRKDMDFLSLLQDRKVQFVRGTSTDLSDGGPENGMYEYDACIDSERDCWFIHFHAAGKDPAPTTLLSRASDDGNIWRAVGDHTGIFDDDKTRELKPWHIIAVKKWG